MANKWVAGLLGLLLQPLAFLYLQRPKWALIYLLLVFAVGIAEFLLIKNVGYSGLGILFAVICAIHAFIYAKQVTFDQYRKWYSRWQALLAIPILLLIVTFSFRSFLYEPFQMPSASMLPTLKVGDYIVVSKWNYGLYGTYGINFHSASIDDRKMPRRGEIFVFYPPQEKRVFVKRIVGLPGDRLEFRDKQLTVNGIKVETMTTDGSEVYAETIDGIHYSVQYANERSNLREFSIVVPENSYFTMGDNRDNSSDSRFWGPVPAENIVGKVVAIW